MDKIDGKNVDFNKLYKLHTGHRIFNESDESSTSSESNEQIDNNKPPVFSYEELKSNLVTYEPGRKTEGATSGKPNKDSHDADYLKSLEQNLQEIIKKLALPDYCYICDADLEQPANAKSHYKSHRHKVNVAIWKEGERKRIKNITPLLTHGLENHNTGQLSQSDTQLFCSLCNKRALSEQHLAEHVKGAKHVKKLQQLNLTGPKKIRTTVIDIKVEKPKMVAVAQPTSSNQDKQSESISVDNLKVLDTGIAAPVNKVLNLPLSKTNETEPDTRIFCSHCNIRAPSEHHMTQHVKSAKHVRKLQEQSLTVPKKIITPVIDNKVDKAKIVSVAQPTSSSQAKQSLESVPVDSLKVLDTVISAPVNKVLNLPPSKTNDTEPMFCSLCNIRAPSAQHMAQHVKGEKHVKKLQEQNFTVPKKIVTPVIDNKVKKAKMVTVAQPTSSSKAKQSLETNSVDKLKVLEPVNRVLELPLSKTKKTDPIQCFLCNLLFASQEALSAHQSSFPHCKLIIMKNELVSQGIVSQYWVVRKRQGAINCLICDATLQTSSSTQDHLRSWRHIDFLDEWVKTRARVAKMPDSTWYFCDSCNINLDGTSNAKFHYQSKTHLTGNTILRVKVEHHPPKPEINQADSCDVVKAASSAQDNSADRLFTTSEAPVAEDNHSNNNSKLDDKSQNSPGNRNEEVLDTNIEQSLEDNNELCNLVAESKPVIPSHRQTDLSGSDSADIDREENLRLHIEVLSQIDKFLNLVYFGKIIPHKLALEYLQKFNRELKHENLTDVKEDCVNTVPRSQEDFKVSNNVTTKECIDALGDIEYPSIIHIKHKNLADVKEDCFSVAPTSEEDFEVSTNKCNDDLGDNEYSSIIHKAQTNLKYKSSVIFHTSPEAPEPKASNGRFMLLKLFACGTGGIIILMYLVKRL